MADYSMYYPPNRTFSFHLNWKKNDDSREIWTAKFFQDTFKIVFEEDRHEGSVYYQAYMLNEHGVEKDVIGCCSSLDGVKIIVDDWIQLQISLMRK